MRKFERKSVRFRLYSLFTLLTLATMLFVSCAGGASSADGDVGYLTFGSSRDLKLSDLNVAPFNITARNLTALTLKGTKGGKTTILYEWATYDDIPGTAIPVPVGSWTFELTGTVSYIPGINTVFYSEQEAVITAGEDTSVTFIMTYAGYPLSQASSGALILSNGYWIHAEDYSDSDGFCSELVAKYPPVAVAVTTSNGLYGINPTVLQSGQYSQADSFPSTRPELVDGWGLPSIELMSEIYSYYDDISGALGSLGTSLSRTTYWTSSTLWFYDFSEGSSYPDFSSMGRPAIYVKRYN